ncbi:MAG TPA: hypothetical protein VE994_08015 [Terriglobales bacterium]|nr:hypothetical protein [Terriglobales bacterium]
MMIRRRTRFSAVVLSVVLCSGMLFAQGKSKAKEAPSRAVTMSGVVSDAMCGAKHMMQDKSAAECTRECVKKGSKFALVSGDKLYTLEGHEAELDKYAGQRVTISGTMKGDTITVNAVKGS